MNEGKKFSQSLYNQCDPASVKMAANFLSTWGWKVKDATERFKIGDILFTYDGTDHLVEVEVKKVWIKHFRWQGWDTVDVPLRKRHNQSEWYVMFNIHLDTLAIIEMRAVQRSPVKQKNTIYTNNEGFYKVKLSLFDFYGRFDGTWMAIPAKGYGHDG